MHCVNKGGKQKPVTQPRKKIGVQYIIASVGFSISYWASGIAPQAGAGFPHLVEHRVVRCRFIFVRRDNL